MKYCFFHKLKRVLFLILLSCIFTPHPVWSRLDLKTIDYLSDDDLRAERFLKEIAQQILEAIPARFRGQRPVFITINHIVPTILPYLSTLSSIGDVAMIIPKGNNPNPQVHLDLKTAYNDNYKMRDNPDNTYTLTMTRTMLNSPESVLDLLRSIQDRYEARPILIIDIGGYFVNALKIPQGDFVRERINLVGIVEDTENGHQKYEEALKEGRMNDIPLYSVARSDLKKTEDYCVGKSIVEATDTLFRTKKHTIIERMQTVGVMGYGKIGASIADHLRRKNVHVFVSERVPLRAQLALSNDHNVVFNSDAPNEGYRQLFSRTNIIFGATGQKALTIADLKEWLRSQNVIYLSSCTSAVDEYAFNPSFLDDDDYFERYREDDQILEFTAERGAKKIVFFRGGNAVNFCFGGVNGPYIYSVQAALLTAASKLFEHSPQLEPEPVAVPLPAARRDIARRRDEITAPIGSRHWQTESVPVSRAAPPLTVGRAHTPSPSPGIIRELSKNDETNISKTFLRFFKK